MQRSFILFLFLTVVFFSACNVNQRERREMIEASIVQLDSIHNMLNALDHSLPTDSFFTVYSQIRALYEVIPDTSYHKINSYFKVCDELHNNGAYHEAIRQGLHGIAISRHPRMQNNGENSRQLLYGLLAGCYIRMGQMDSALVMYQTARQRSHLIPDTIARASAINNQGVFFYNENLIDSARRCFVIADSLLQMHDLREPWMRSFHGSVKNNLAILSEKEGDFKKARLIYQDNYKLYSRIKSMRQLISSGISLANAMLETGSENEAMALLDDMKGILDTTRIDNKLEQSIRLASIYYRYFEQRGQYEQALVYADREILLSDSLRKLDDKKMVKTMAQLADINSAEFSLKMELERKAVDTQKQYALLQLWIFIGLVVVAIGSFIFLIVFYRQRSKLHKNRTTILEDKRLMAEKQLKAETQEKRFAELELENKKKDLVQMAMHLSNKQEWARYLNAMFERVESSKGYHRQKELGKLKSEIRSQINVDRDIEMLQQNVETLSASFYDKLLEHFPDLSKTEIRMCGYIRLDLSTDQIAQLQNIDPSSIKVRRYRLKKKLKLSQSDNLDAFLRSL